MADWGGLAKKYGVEQKKEDPSKKNKQASGSNSSVSGMDAIDKAKRDVLSATALADKVDAKFKEADGTAGGSVGDCVASKLGDCAKDLGLSKTQQATKSISIGPGSSSSSDDKEEE